MAIRQVERYAVAHQIGGKVEIRLRFSDGTDPLVLKGVPVDEARLLLDILRNESGVSHDDVKKRLLMSVEELVGHGGS